MDRQGCGYTPSHSSGCTGWVYSHRTVIKMSKDNKEIGWKDAPHMIKDIAGTIASAYIDGRFEALRSIPPEGYEAFVKWLKRVL